MEYYDELKIYCTDFGFHYEEKFDKFYIKTSLEAWYVENRNGIIYLFHGNTFGRNPNGYHKQFSRIVNPYELILYIKEHGEAKFLGKRSEFSLTKTGARKNRVIEGYV